MANQIIAPILPGMGPQAEAVSGSQAVIFTETDRKIIQERSGEINKKLSFKELLSQRPLTQKVENEQTTIKPEENVRELEERYREHQKMLKNSPLIVHKDHIYIKNEQPSQEREETTTQLEPGYITKDKNPSTSKNDHSDQIDHQLHKETIAIAKELKLDPSELFDKFSLEQKELFGLVARIKDLHLKRLLSETHEDFDAFSKQIKQETFALVKPEAHNWLENQLDRLTFFAAEYKLSLMKSLQSIDFCTQREKSIRWLKKTVATLSKNAE